ncbi:hypothetical protein QPK13_23110 [Photorhabdus tasmaniensis]
MSDMLSMSEREKLEAFLSAVLNDYKNGAITQRQAVGGIAKVFVALDSGDSVKVNHLLKEGRKLLREG